MPTRSRETLPPQRRLFGHERPLHAVLGGGKLADIMLWEDKRLSGAICAGFSVVWFLFEVVEYRFVTLLCHMLIAIMLILFIWHNAAGLITWRPPTIYDVEIPEYAFRNFFRKFNWFLKKFYEISIGKDLKLFFVTISGLWIMSAIGSYFTTMNLLYLVFICMITLPTMYERYELEVDYLASKGNQDVKRLFNALDSKVLDKIPRGPVKQKKYK